jgi:hypothetical protein
MPVAHEGSGSNGGTAVLSGSRTRRCELSLLARRLSKQCSALIGAALTEWSERAEE